MELITNIILTTANILPNVRKPNFVSITWINFRYSDGEISFMVQIA